MFTDYRDIIDIIPPQIMSVDAPFIWKSDDFSEQFFMIGRESYHNKSQEIKKV